jgi:hypothetical protein
VAELKIGKNLKKILPLFQLEFLKEAGGAEFNSILQNLEEQIISIPELYKQSDLDQSNQMVYAHYFYGGSDWYVLEWDREENLFFGYVILNQDFFNAEYGYFSFEELDETRKIELDFHWQIKPLMEIVNKIKPQREPEQSKTESETVPETNLLISDNWFIQYPEKVLGTKTSKIRGDRGGKVEEIIEGSIENIKSIALPNVPIVEDPLNYDNEDLLILLRMRHRSLSIRLKYSNP